MTKCRRVLFAVGACLSLASPAAAVVAFDDHFDDNSGGMPVGWFGIGDGTVVEAGTVVTLTDAIIIATDIEVDPNQPGGTFLTTEIAGTAQHTHSGLVDAAQLDNHFWIKIWAADGRIEVKAANVADGEQEYTVGYVIGYTGGVIGLTVVLDESSFTVATDAPPFMEGPIPYADVFTSFTRADLGHVAKLVLENECPVPESPCWSSYDRLTMETGLLAAESVTWGAIKTLYGR